MQAIDPINTSDIIYHSVNQNRVFRAKSMLYLLIDKLNFAIVNVIAKSIIIGMLDNHVINRIITKRIIHKKAKFNVPKKNYFNF